MLSFVGAASTRSFVYAALRRNTPLISSPRFPLRTLSSIRMSSSEPQSNLNQIIEHLVFLKVKPDADPSAVEAMVTNTNGLKSIDTVLHISAGPVFRCRSSALTFTHMLHSRYRSKADLANYSDHPTHVNVVTNYVKPVIDDLMAVDWVSDDFSGPVAVPSGSAMRLTVLKVKESAGEEGKEAVLRVLKGIKDKFPSIEQLSVGENFSPGRNKGFSIASIAVFRGVEELEKLNLQSELANEEKDKVREFIDSVVVLDYLVGASVEAAAGV